MLGQNEETTRAIRKLLNALNWWDHNIIKQCAFVHVGPKNINHGMSQPCAD